MAKLKKPLYEKFPQAIADVSKDNPLFGLTALYLRTENRFLVFANKSAEVCNEIMAFEIKLLRAVEKGEDPSEEELKEGERGHDFIRAYQEMRAVYAVALFESYLNGVTSWLFHKEPERVLGNASIEIRRLTAQTRAEVLNQAVERKLRAFSHEGIINRLAELERMFRLDLNLAKNELDRLKSIFDARNDIVHANFTHSICLNDNLELQFLGHVHERQRIDDPTEFFDRVVKFIYYAIIVDVLGRDPSGNEEGILISLTPPEQREKWRNELDLGRKLKRGEVGA